MTRRKAAPWQAPEEVLKLLPALSGNAVNGQGEPARRRPTPVFWHPPDRIAHGALQRRIEDRYQTHPDLANFWDRYGGRGEPAAPKAERPAQDTPESWAQHVKQHALAHEADLVGITRVDPEWVYEGYEVDLPWLVMLGVAMAHGELAKAPEMAAQVEIVKQYNRGTRAARAVADWIRSHGYEAKPHGGPRAGPINMIPAALACGFGELGKHGSIINRTFGSSFRLAVVLTDLPLVGDHPEEFGADEFCMSCRLCSAACPPDAIFDVKQQVRGVEKWYVDFDRCIPYFDATYGCGICIAVCPWSRPGTAPRLAEKLTRRRSSKQQG